MKNNHRNSHKSQDNKQKPKFVIIMKDQWTARLFLDMGTQWKDDVKHWLRVRGATAKDTTKISAPAPKSNVVSAEQTTKQSTEIAQYSK